MISGKPVKSSMARTSMPASVSAVAVPPVETISTPSSASPRAKSTMPRLSETDSSARWMRTAPGAVGASGEVSEAMGPMVFGCPPSVPRGAARGVLDDPRQQPRQLGALGRRQRREQILLGLLHAHVEALDRRPALGGETHQVAPRVGRVALAADEALALEVGDYGVQVAAVQRQAA